jgi:hypothetical protein
MAFIAAFNPVIGLPTGTLQLGSFSFGGQKDLGSIAERKS